ncbi:hypothetical protein [Citrobacter sp. NCU1]|uniref:hypothetical protein n=1 Tax=Citrobacter sp. NCU1 TaxID=2026683 RepID=UPI001EE37440|nr:hypothetical protein [Citrobacter sp. NCU1]
MDSEKFIDALNIVVKDAAVVDVVSLLKSPPGKKPSKELVDVSNFYNSHTDDIK